MQKMIWTSVAMCTALGAQGVPADELSALMLNTRLSGAASKRVQTLEAAPADATILTGEELEALGYRTLGDALGGVLGFRTNEDRSYQLLGVRGTQVPGDFNTRVLILLDGHTLNSPAEVGSSKVGEDLGIPLERISRIEVVRGPASSLYGSNAFQGMVNVVTKDSAKGRDSFQGALTGASNGLQEAWLHGEQRLGFATLSITGSSMQRGGTSLTLPDLQAAPLSKDLDREYRQSAYLRLQGGSDVPWSLATYLMSRQQHVPTAPFQTTIGDDRMVYRNRQQFFEGRVDPRLGLWEGFLRVFGDYNQYSDELPNDGVRLPGTLGMQQDMDPDRSLGFEAQLRRPLGEQFFFTLGTEQRWHRFRGRLEGAGVFVSTDVDYEIRNVYFQGEYTPVKSLQLVAGVQRAANSAADRGFFPRFALVWQPAEGTTLKVLSGQGLRQPTIFERYYQDTAFVQNPALRPERLLSNQAIWHQIWAPGFQTQVSVLDYSWQRLIQVQALPGDTQQFTNAADEAEGRAYEFEGRWQAGQLELYGQVGLYRARLQGQDLPNTAKTQAAFRAIYHLSDWSLAGEWRHVGGRELQDVPLRAPAADTFRLSLRYNGAHYWVQATGEDLTDARRRDFLAPEYDPVREMPGEGRMLRATLGLRF